MERNQRSVSLASMRWQLQFLFLGIRPCDNKWLDRQNLRRVLQPAQLQGIFSSKHRVLQIQRHREMWRQLPMLSSVQRLYSLPSHCLPRYSRVPTQQISRPGNRNLHDYCTVKYDKKRLRNGHCRDLPLVLSNRRNPQRGFTG